MIFSTITIITLITLITIVMMRIVTTIRQPSIDDEFMPPAVLEKSESNEGLIMVDSDDSTIIVVAVFIWF